MRLGHKARAGATVGSALAVPPPMGLRGGCCCRVLQGILGFLLFFKPLEIHNPGRKSSPNLRDSHFCSICGTSCFAFLYLFGVVFFFFKALLLRSPDQHIER